MDWEFSFLYALQELHNPVLDEIMIVITQLGDHGMIWIAIAFVCLLMKKHQKTGVQVLLSLLLTYIVGNLILKNVIARPRPFVADADVLSLLIIPKPGEYSFPSGHTMNGFAAAFSIFFNNRKAGIPALILAGLIAFSRMYHFVHYPTDILGGFFVGLGMAVLVDYIYNKALFYKTGS